MVVRRADFLSVFDKPQRDALAMLFLKLRDSQNTAAEVLWGVWLFPLAVLGQIAIPAGVFGRVAGNRRLSLRCLKHGRDTMARISGHGIYDLPACHFLRDSIDAVAGD
jgi:hypothetical protein